MGIKLAIGGGVLVLFALFLANGCFLGDGGETPASVLRRGTIATATPPANLPEPIVLGESNANTGSPTPTAAGGGSYTVKSGDTIGGIAAQLGIAPAEQATWTAAVLQLNGITDARSLAVGQTLVLPRTNASTTATTTTTTGSGPTATRPAGTQTPAAAAATATPRPASADGGTYTVVAEDTPLSIGAKLGVPSAQLTAWANELVALNNKSSTALQIGEVLQLPPNTPGR